MYFIRYIIIGTKIHIMVKRIAMRIYIKRVRKMVIINIPNLIYTWKLSVQVMSRWGRAHKRFTSTFTLPLI